MYYKKTIISIALLLTCVTLGAQQKAPDMEQQLVQRLQEAQMSGNDKEFYKAHDAFLRYLEKYDDWDKYYRTRMTRIIYEVNNKRFHRAFMEVHQLTNDIKERHHEQYLYVSNMGLGFFYDGRNQHELAGQAIRRAFVTTIYEKLKSPINVLRGYAHVFNDPNFQLKPEERPKRYSDIIAAARSIESLIDPMLDSYVRGTAGITDEEKRVCMDALRSPLLTLINTSEVIIEGHGEIPHEEYMELRSCVCRDAYHVSTATHQLILYSLYGDEASIPKPDRLKLNEVAQSILNSYDLTPSAIDQNRHLGKEFLTDVPDDVEIHANPMLQELLNCLLDNADKYASGGTVKMSCHDCGDGTYAIAVFNEGPAISADDAERIFAPFVRLYPEEHSLGIGLSLARNLVKLMGYEVTLDTSYTQGARFVVSGL